MMTYDVPQFTTDPIQEGREDASENMTLSRKGKENRQKWGAEIRLKKQTLLQGDVAKHVKLRNVKSWLWA